MGNTITLVETLRRTPDIHEKTQTGNPPQPQPPPPPPHTTPNPPHHQPHPHPPPPPNHSTPHPPTSSPYTHSRDTASTPLLRMPTKQTPPPTTPPPFRCLPPLLARPPHIAHLRTTHQAPTKRHKPPEDPYPHPPLQLSLTIRKQNPPPPTPPRRTPPSHPPAPPIAICESTTQRLPRALSARYDTTRNPRPNHTLNHETNNTLPLPLIARPHIRSLRAPAPYYNTPHTRHTRTISARKSGTQHTNQHVHMCSPKHVPPGTIHPPPSISNKHQTAPGAHVVKTSSPDPYSPPHTHHISAPLCPSQYYTLKATSRPATTTNPYPPQSVPRQNNATSLMTAVPSDQDTTRPPRALRSSLTTEGLIPICREHKDLDLMYGGGRDATWRAGARGGWRGGGGGTQRDPRCSPAVVRQAEAGRARRQTCRGRRGQFGRSAKARQSIAASSMAGYTPIWDSDKFGAPPQISPRSACPSWPSGGFYAQLFYSTLRISTILEEANRAEDC